MSQCTILNHCWLLAGTFRMSQCTRFNHCWLCVGGNFSNEPMSHETTMCQENTISNLHSRRTACWSVHVYSGQWRILPAELNKTGQLGTWFRYGDDELEKRNKEKGKKKTKRERERKGKKEEGIQISIISNNIKLMQQTRRLSKNLMLMTTKMKTSFTLSSRWS